MSLDPIVLALVQNRLDHISRQMGWIMTRTAHSPIFSQAHDFSCFLTDADGMLVSTADGIPIHTGGGGFAVRAVLKAFAGRIYDGDVFLLSDPYTAGGNHLPDWVIARPVFTQGVLNAFACNRAHQSDIGGGAAGTYNADATEIYHEGIRLPVLKLIEVDEVREDVWQLLLLNSRTPDLMDGDLHAMIGSTRIGAERISALVEELGLEEGRAYLEGILSHADRVFRAAISELPDGRYEALSVTDNDCFERIDYTVRVALTISGDALTVDFTGTDPQMKGFKNSSVANTFSSVCMALVSFLGPDIPRNEGTFRGVEIIMPEGTLVNALPPAAMTMNTVYIAYDIIHAIWKALSEADPSRSCAGWAKNVHPGTAGGIGSNRPFVTYHWNAMAGAGAAGERDGFNQIGLLVTLGGLTLPDIEVYEQLYPVRYLRSEFRCDTGGPGEWRGGTGVDYEAEVEVPAEYSLRGEGLHTPSGYGIDGGGWGKAGSLEIFPEDGEPIDPPQFGVRNYGPLRLKISSPGGGGRGHPFERDPERVLRDVRDGVVSGEAAAGTYGVVINGDGRSIDIEATQKRRSEAAHA